MQVTITHTRRSIATQLKEALDDMVAKEVLDLWTLTNGTSYFLAYVSGFIESDLSPGNCMDLVNRFGNYDVRFGKA